MVGISEYGTFANNPIINADPLGDTIRPVAGANAIGNSFTQKGAVDMHAQDNLFYKGMTMTPTFFKNGKMAGYTVMETNSSEVLLEMQLSDFAEFKKNYDTYVGLAKSFNKVSSGWQKFWAGFLDFGKPNYNLSLEGIKE